MSASNGLLLVYKDAVIVKEEKKNHHRHRHSHHHHHHQQQQQQKEVAEEELESSPSPQKFLLRKPLSVQKSSPNIVTNKTAIAIAAAATTTLKKKPLPAVLPKPPSPAAKRAVSSTPASSAPAVSPVSPHPSDISALHPLSSSDLIHGVSSPVSCNSSSVPSPTLNVPSLLKPISVSSPVSTVSSAVSPSTPAIPASLCSDCRRATSSASSNGAVCFIGNNGRVSACSVRSAITLCKNLHCAANNPAYVAAMSTIAPKKYLISKRHQLPSYALMNAKLKSPSPSPSPSPSHHHHLESKKNSLSHGGLHHNKDVPAHSPFHASSLSEHSKDMSRSMSLSAGSEEDSLSCDMESLHLVSNGDSSIEEKMNVTMPLHSDMVLPPSEFLDPSTKESFRDNACCLVESSLNVSGDCLRPQTDESEEDFNDLMLGNGEIISCSDEHTNDADDSDSHDCESISNETVQCIDPCPDACFDDKIDSVCDGSSLSEEFAMANGDIEPSNIGEELSMVNGDIVASNENEDVHAEHLNTGIDHIMSSHVETSDGSEYAETDALIMLNGATKHNLGDEHNDEGNCHNCDDVNGHANGSHVCVVDSNERRLQRRAIRVLDVIEDSNPESVTLRKQKALERKAAEEWMLNHAIEGVVHKLAPTGKAKVKVLVEAFESVISHQGLLETPNQS